MQVLAFRRSELLNLVQKDRRFALRLLPPPLVLGVDHGDENIVTFDQAALLQRVLDLTRHKPGGEAISRISVLAPIPAWKLIPDPDSPAFGYFPSPRQNGVEPPFLETIFASDASVVPFLAQARLVTSGNALKGFRLEHTRSTHCESSTSSYITLACLLTYK